MDWIFDADSHVTEPRDLWTSRLASKFREGAPHVERDESGKDWWVIDGKRTDPPGVTAVSGWREPLPSTPTNWDQFNPVAFDAKARLEYLDTYGIWAQMLYPNVGGFGNQAFLKMRDSELQLACVRAYNDWLVEWASADSRRLVPVMALPFWNVDEAVAEIHRAADLGHKGILFSPEPHRFGQPLIGHPHWNPLWTAATERDLPISFHIGGGDFEVSHMSERAQVHGVAPTWVSTSVELSLKIGAQFADVVMSGVPARFPELKFVSVESSIGWVPFVLEAMDHYFEEFSVRRERPEFEYKPSEYFRRQIKVCYFFEKYAPQALLNEIGVDNVLFETDIPHAASLHGHIQECIDASLAGYSAEVRRKVLWENGAKLYKLDAPDREPAAAAA